MVDINTFLRSKKELIIVNDYCSVISDYNHGDDLFFYKNIYMHVCFFKGMNTNRRVLKE